MKKKITKIMSCSQTALTIMTIFLVLPAVFAAKPPVPKQPIPAEETKLNSWFHKNVKPYTERRGDLDEAVVEAEEAAKVIKVRKNGSGDFITVAEAIKSVPADNTERVIISIGSGEYHEKIRIERNQPFVTLYGEPNAMPKLVFGGTAKTYGTLDSATVTILGDYFVAANIIFVNSAPRPTLEMKGAQALAVRISGDKSAFYNCKFIGFQDTLCDHRGRHFFKDCYVQGTIDYIFGGGRSLYLNTELKTLGGEGNTFITAQAREKDDETGFSFVHCRLTGDGNGTYLGRPWMAKPRVVFAYTTMSNVINPEGWALNNRPSRSKTVYFAEFKNKGPGANVAKRPKYVKQLSETDSKRFISLDFIDGRKWLLPPPNYLQVPGDNLKKLNSESVLLE